MHFTFKMTGFDENLKEVSSLAVMHKKNETEIHTLS